MTAKRRMEQVEAALSPQALVLRWLAEVQAYPTLADYARTTVDVPESDSPLSRVIRGCQGFARSSTRGSREEVDAAVRRAVGDGVFQFCLVLVCNQAAVDVARLEGLRATAVFFWMGCLLGGPHDRTPEDERELTAAWQTWLGVLGRIEHTVAVDAAARRSIEQRYLGGQPSLFQDAGAEWASLEDYLARLGQLAEPIAAASKLGGGANDSAVGEDDVESRARHLADDARVKASELLGERWRAVRIMERRLVWLSAQSCLCRPPTAPFRFPAACFPAEVASSDGRGPAEPCWTDQPVRPLARASDPCSRRW